MKICPKCKNEYRKGITHCADCGCALIDESEEQAVTKLLLEADYPLAKRAKEYLEYSKFKTISMDEPDENGVVRLSCEEKEWQNAWKQAQVFMQAETQKAVEQQLSQMSEEEVQQMVRQSVASTPPSNVYQNYKEKAEEHKSSAESFFIIGGIGIVLVILSWFGLLPFYIGGEGNWFSHGTVLAIFVSFIAVGISSAKSVGKYKEMAEKEDDAQSKMEKYLAETFTYEILSQIKAATEEEAYFKRMNFMRERVAVDFGESMRVSSFIESLLDKHYDKIFG